MVVPVDIVAQIGLTAPGLCLERKDKEEGVCVVNIRCRVCGR